MDENQLEARQLEDAAVVHATRRRIGEAVAALAVRPLDEPAAALMRAALASQGSARAAIARLEAAERPGSADGMFDGDPQLTGPLDGELDRQLEAQREAAADGSSGRDS